MADEIIGRKDRNLVLHTAGRINVLVGDKYYEIPYREMGNTISEPEPEPEPEAASYSMRFMSRSVPVDNENDYGFEYIYLSDMENDILLSKKTSNISIDTTIERPVIKLPIGNEYNGYKVNIYAIKDIVLDRNVIKRGTYSSYVYVMIEDNKFN